jgi:hypothetical protein
MPAFFSMQDENTWLRNRLASAEKVINDALAAPLAWGVVLGTTGDKVVIQAGGGICEVLRPTHLRALGPGARVRIEPSSKGILDVIDEPFSHRIRRPGALRRIAPTTIASRRSSPRSRPSERPRLRARSSRKLGACFAGAASSPRCRW